MSSWFGGPSSSSKHHSHSHSHSNSYKQEQSRSRRSPSPKRYFVRPHSPSAQSTRSFSSFWSRPHASSSSYYKRRPRDGYISRIVHTIKRYLRDLIDYAKRHPMKVFMLVIMPLLTGGALHNLLRGMGIRLPASLAGFMGGNSSPGGHGHGYGGDAGRAGESGGMGLEQVMNIAKMFM